MNYYKKLQEHACFTITQSCNPLNGPMGGGHMKQPENYDENSPEELAKKKNDAAQLMSAVLRSLINNP